MLSYHNISFRDALIDLYPELNFAKKKFAGMYTHYTQPRKQHNHNTETKRERMWTKKEFRREFFDKLARREGFEPLDLNRWYDISFHSVTHEKVIINIHNNNYDNISEFIQ